MKTIRENDLPQRQLNVGYIILGLNRLGTEMQLKVLQVRQREIQSVSYGGNLLLFM